ncbi:sensor histidine kinase [Sphingobacterium sp. PCS056]|uniref:sensor histidine kinase n=1 Tax=Sphingobacterium TaxID=28453 RepID=UPI00200EE05D|nr:sensor histidine kinase [Sphingobacterium sp. PCS056]UPZ38738.1 sensor histidine kinase [Sphingobacterium sp. PCS056]
MILKINNNRWNFIKKIALFLVVTPLILIFLVVITSNKNSVVLFENFSPKLSISIITFYFLLCLVLISFGIYWLVMQIIAIFKLKNEKTKAELMLLKSQVNPHFFFNTLNNLYGLVDKDAQKAREMILKLSDLMRYSIYEGEKETVAIQEEIDFLKNYIELHQMRYHKEISIDFKCDIDNNRKVVPLLYIILLENAFKHGIENLRDHAYIKMELKTSQHEISFTIENNYEKIEKQSGIGLGNLKRRLELIYPNQHELTYFSTDSVYQARLILKTL